MNDPEYKYSNNYFKRLFQRYVWGPQNWTKRIIGIPGDTIRRAIERHPVVYRNGIKLDEPYINAYPLSVSFRKILIEYCNEGIQKEIKQLSVNIT